jgi:hypothetical protein
MLALKIIGAIVLVVVGLFVWIVNDINKNGVER